MFNDMTFNFNRFLMFLKIELFVHGKSFISLLAIFGGLMIIASLWFSGGQELHNTYNALYVFMLFAGMGLTSISWAKLHEHNEGSFYVLLPGSLFEKYLAKWLLTSLIFILASLIFAYGASVIAMCFNYFLYGFVTPLFNPFNYTIAGGMRNFLFSHAIFFCGSIYFRNKAALKTIISIMAFSMALVFFGALTIRIVYGDFINLHHSFSLNLEDLFADYYGFTNVLNYIAKGVVWGITPLFFWCVAFIRLTELEVE